MENKIDIGYIVVVINERHNGLKYQEQEIVVLELLNILKQNVTKNNFGFDLEFEVINIQNGCIKAKIGVFFAIATACATAVVNYPSFKAGAKELWNDCSTVYVQCLGEKTQAHLHKNNLVSSIYGPVIEGQTLSEITLQFDKKHYSNEQFMLGLFRENQHAFFGDNINNLKSGEILKYPRNEVMQGIGKKEGQLEVQRQNKSFAKSKK